MSKVATYLRGHVSGEVSTRADVCEAMSIDTGVLKVTPEMVIYPRSTNDIRKVARFVWQLAEKGHSLPITVRGAGTDSTGAAIGSGIALVTTAHMNQIFEYEPKQKLVRLQPGATLGALNQALSLHGTSVMSLAGSHLFGTVGGAIASGVTGPLAGKYGGIKSAIDQLEVVLANGDVIQTERVSKRELSRRKGLQGFEGDVYRGIDGIIEEYNDVILGINANDATGYNAIANVKKRDGSFDLTPLFVGSQGTLGIITEMIMRAEFHSRKKDIAALVFSDNNTARDTLDDIRKMPVAFAEYFDAELFETAAAKGRGYSFYSEAAKTIKPTSVVIMCFDDFSDRQRAKNVKKLSKLVSKRQGVQFVTADYSSADEIVAALDVTYYTVLPDHADMAAPNIFGGFYIPTERLEDFTSGLRALAKKLHISLPLAGHVQTNTYSVYPSLELHKVSDKQKIFKLLDELTKLVYSYDGTMVAEGGEGRLKAKFIYSQIDEHLVQMYTDIRKVCDPHGILSPGVKQDVELRNLTTMLRDSHDAGQLARFGL